MDAKKNYKEVHESISRFISAKKSPYPLYRVNLLKSLVESNDNLEALLKVEFSETSSRKLDFLLPFPPDKIVEIAKDIKFKLKIEDSNKRDFKVSTIEELRKLLTEDHELKERYLIISELAENTELNNIQITNFCALGSFVHPHISHLELMDMALNKAKELNYPNPQVLVFAQYNHVRREDFSQSYDRRINQLNLAFSNRTDINVMNLPGDNYNDFNSQIADILARANGKLFWLWGSDNLIKFIDSAINKGSHYGIFANNRIEFMISKRSDDKRDELEVAYAKLNKNFHKDVIKLPDRGRKLGVHVSSTYLENLNQSDAKLKKLSLIRC
ncbi:MAG TPA: hypothetical protein PLS49_08770 [Candidatus Woesebacteria bacterium]|nr:hypothetical protein [Candidatus Woesebacteria bacterium]